MKKTSSWWSALGVLVWLPLACGAESEPTLPDDDGTRITGVGGSVVASTASATVNTVGASATAGVGGGGGQGGGCVDIGLGEPNSSEGSAWALKGMPIEDCDGDGGMITGTLAPGDVDWFTYQGDDTTFCNVDPSRSFSPAGVLRICKFVRCIDSGANTEFDCPNGTTDATSPDGRAGCCSDAGFDLGDVNCTGTLDEFTEVFIRIDRPTGTGCTDYTLSYHY